MDFGCGDIITGIKLIRKIYLNGFVEDFSAGVQYRNFANDIQGFEKLLVNLNASIENAHERYSRVALPPSGTYNPVAEDFQAERRSFIGDFQATLRECGELLEKRRKFLGRRSTVAENLYYNLSTEGHVIEDLRRRIHMHSTKIKLAIDRLSINLLTDVDSKVDELLDIANRNLRLTNDVRHELHLFYAQFLGIHAGREPLPDLLPHDIHIPTPLIRERFNGNLLQNAPSTFNGDIPLAEGFDVLLMYYEQSIKGTDQTPEKYLALLKTRWLLVKIQESRGYSTACPGFYHKRAVNQIALAVKSHVNERNIIAFEEQELLELPPAEYLVWPLPLDTKTPAPDFTAARGGESEVIRVPLDSGNGSEANTLAVFRKSETGKFRIAWEALNHDGRAAIFNLLVHTESDKLIPRYALPTVVERRHEIAIFSRGEEHLFNFPSDKELIQFQAAITGFEVPYEQNGIQCQFSKGAVELDGQSNIQIWQDPIQLNSATPNLGVLSQGGSSRTVTAGNSISASTSSPQGFTPSVTLGSTVQHTPDGWEADKIRLPALVIFKQAAEIKKDVPFVILHIKLEKDFMIDAEGCNCFRSYDHCAYLCLKRRKSKFLPIQTASTNLDSEGYPDPNSFDLLPFHRSDQRGIAHKRSEYLLLGFTSLEKKKGFHVELNRRFALIDKQMEQRSEAQKDFVYHESRTAQKSMNRRPSESARQVASSPIRNSLSVPPSTAENGSLSPTRSSSNRQWPAPGPQNGFDTLSDLPPAVSLSTFQTQDAHSRGSNRGSTPTASAWAQSQFNREVFETEYAIYPDHSVRKGQPRVTTSVINGRDFPSTNGVVDQIPSKPSRVKKFVNQFLT